MARTPTPVNPTLLQTFEWHTQSDAHSSHYNHLRLLLTTLSRLGVTRLWLPPGCKAWNPQGNGYDCYDLWDLGEFDQKGSRSTKWGSRDELTALIAASHDLEMDCVWDAVLNHKQSGDSVQNGVWAVEVDPEDRRVEIATPLQIQAWLRYDFPGRAGKYSDLRWRAEHFNGTDWDQSRERHGIFKLIDEPSTGPSSFDATINRRPHRPRTESGNRLKAFLQSMKSARRPQSPPRRPGKGWASDVDTMHGNYDYLMFSNIDFSHPAVRADMLAWGRWMLADVGIDGFRLDAARHISRSFTREWIGHVRSESRRLRGRDPFIVGEVWDSRVRPLLQWLDAVDPDGTAAVLAYDAPLLHNFSRLSRQLTGDHDDNDDGTNPPDLRALTRDSLLQHRPRAAITLVTNHDTQPGQTCAVPMDSSLKTLWYAYILLRDRGSPCVFWGDLVGTRGPFAEPPACSVPGQGGPKYEGPSSLLPHLMLCRRLFAYGRQSEFVGGGGRCLGWTRAGTHDRPGCAVVMNISQPEEVETVMMAMGGAPGDRYIDILGRAMVDSPSGVDPEVVLDGKGRGGFRCRGRSVAVYVRRSEVGLFDEAYAGLALNELYGRL